MINERAKTNNVQPLLTLYFLAVTEFVPRLGNFSQPVTRLRGCAEERELQTGLGTPWVRDGDTGIGQKSWAITPFVLSQALVRAAIVLIFPAMNGPKYGIKFLQVVNSLWQR